MSDRATAACPQQLASVFIGTSMVTANGTGFSQVNGGVIKSYVNNGVDNNTSNGAATAPAVPPL